MIPPTVVALVGRSAIEHRRCNQGAQRPAFIACTCIDIACMTSDSKARLLLGEQTIDCHSHADQQEAESAPDHRLERRLSALPKLRVSVRLTSNVRLAHFLQQE
jgi:hypothetical protein